MNNTRIFLFAMSALFASYIYSNPLYEKLRDACQWQKQHQIGVVGFHSMNWLPLAIESEKKEPKKEKVKIQFSDKEIMIDKAIMEQFEMYNSKIHFQKLCNQMIMKRFGYNQLDSNSKPIVFDFSTYSNVNSDVFQHLCNFMKGEHDKNRRFFSLQDLWKMLQIADMLGVSEKIYSELAQLIFEKDNASFLSMDDNLAFYSSLPRSIMFIDIMRKFTEKTSWIAELQNRSNPSILDLSRKNLESLYGLELLTSSQVKIILLNNNALKKLELQKIAYLFPAIKTINASNNQIEALEKADLNAINDHMKIYLQNNDIKKVAKRTVHGAPNQVYVGLQSNKNLTRKNIVNLKSLNKLSLLQANQDQLIKRLKQYNIILFPRFQKLCDGIFLSGIGWIPMNYGSSFSDAIFHSYSLRKAFKEANHQTWSNFGSYCAGSILFVFLGWSLYFKGYDLALYIHNLKNGYKPSQIVTDKLKKDSLLERSQDSELD